MKTLNDVADASGQIVSAMFKNAPPPPPVYTPQPPVYAPPPQPLQLGYQQGEQASGYGDDGVRRAVAAVNTQNEIYNFSVGERWETWFLNWLIPGLGSATIMQDWAGVGYQLGLYALGWGLVGPAIAARDDDVTIPLAIVGGAAFASNITFNIIRSSTYDRPGSIERPKAPKVHKIKNTDFYFAPKYQFPVGTPVSWGGTNAEFGWVWGNGMFFGIDFGFGYSENDYYNDYNDYYDYYDALMIGGGFSLGKIGGSHRILQIIYGGSAGFWYADGYNADFRNREESYNFLAPFIKLRWKYVELTYRGLLGVYERTYDYDSDYGFGWNNHQLMLGLYFVTDRRQR
jgi:hypothetical protein